MLKDQIMQYLQEACFKKSIEFVKLRPKMGGVLLHLAHIYSSLVLQSFKVTLAPAASTFS